MELALLKIMGKFCTGVHFMMVCPDFVREVKAADKGLNHMFFKKVQVSSDQVDLVRVKRPPSNPFKKKPSRKSKEQILEEQD